MKYHQHNLLPSICLFLSAGGNLGERLFGMSHSYSANWLWGKLLKVILCLGVSCGCGISLHNQLILLVSPFFATWNSNCVFVRKWCFHHVLKFGIYIRKVQFHLLVLYMYIKSAQQPPSYSDVTSRQSRGQAAVSDIFVIDSSLVRGLGNRPRQYGVDATAFTYPVATIAHIRSKLNHIFSTGAKLKEVMLQC